jgi:hypothetical protein
MLQQKSCQLTTISWQQLSVGNNNNVNQGHHTLIHFSSAKTLSLSNMNKMQHVYSYKNKSALKGAKF